MSKSVDFYYDYGSPTAYLAWTQLPKICELHQVRLNAQPMLLGGVFKATGNATPVAVEAKGEWLFKDIARYADRYGVPYAMNPHFIINSMSAMRGAAWADAAGCLPEYDAALFKATWVDGIDTGNVDCIAEVLHTAGLDAQAMREAIQTQAIKQDLIRRTEQAVARGVFGAPTMFIGETMHFGQDRLDWVERELAANV